MKVTTQFEYYRAEEVTECAKEELALARLIRCGANHDLVQANKAALSFSRPGAKLKNRGPSTYMLVTILYVRACLVCVRALRCTFRITVLARV
jgi:hypothetical protein